MDTNKRKTGLARLIEIAGTKRRLLIGAMLLAVITAIVQFVPIIAVYNILIELAEHALDPSLIVIVKTCSDICFTIGQKNCQMFVAKLHKFHHPHNRMRFYPAHSVLSFPDFAVDTFLPQRFLR